MKNRCWGHRRKEKKMATRESDTNRDSCRNWQEGGVNRQKNRPTGKKDRPGGLTNLLPVGEKGVGGIWTGGRRKGPMVRVTRPRLGHAESHRGEGRNQKNEEVPAGGC